jgi:GntR family transcriptional regulator of arabinose operon
VKLFNFEKTMDSPKYRQLFESLKNDIVAGRYSPGQKLPSEAALVRRSSMSRITVTRALRELQDAGLVERFAGSGTFVSKTGSVERSALLFGLLIPELGKTEIFAPICHAIQSAPAAKPHALLWGNVSAGGTIAKQALTLADQFLARRVDGVFFAPLESWADAEKINRRILRQLRKSKIAVVLLDRRVSSSFDRDRADLTGINHRQAAYSAAEHLLAVGCRRLCFIEDGGAPSTLSERRAGFHQAAATYQIVPDHAPVLNVEKLASEFRKRIRTKKVDGVVCVNDHTAGRVMQMLIRWGVRIPADVRIVGIDDVNYAAMLPIPLTSVKQPIEQIGDAALNLMLERIRSPYRPTREVLLDGTLVVRESSGVSANRSHATTR